jgi:hypothetical protein
VAEPGAGAAEAAEAGLSETEILARKQGERVQVRSRRGADFTDRFPSVGETVRGLSADETMIDGEAVLFQDDGRSDFRALLTKRGCLVATFVAFDLFASQRRRSGPAPAGGAAGGAQTARRQRGAATELCSARRTPKRARSCSPKRASSASKAPCRSGRAALTQEQAEPQLAQNQEPRFRQDVTAIPRDSITLADVRRPTVVIVCERCGPPFGGGN